MNNKTQSTKLEQEKKVGDDSSDDSLDNKDTGETSGQDPISERNERKRKVKGGFIEWHG